VSQVAATDDYESAQELDQDLPEGPEGALTAVPTHEVGIVLVRQLPNEQATAFTFQVPALANVYELVGESKQRQVLWVTSDQDVVIAPTAEAAGVGKGMLIRSNTAPFRVGYHGRVFVYQAAGTLANVYWWAEYKLG
jgi:hypothetical protein